MNAGNSDMEIFLDSYGVNIIASGLQNWEKI